MEIKEALAQLDPKNDEHWTADGAPRVDVVASLTGNKDLKRQDITDADPTFTRAKDPEPEQKPQEPEVKADEELEPIDLTPKTFDDAMELIGDDFLVDRDLFDPALKLMDDEANRLAKESKELLERSHRVRKRADDLRQFRVNTEPRHNPKARWLERQNEIRAQKAARAGNFVKNSGATPGEIADVLNVHSPIDAALRARPNPPRTLPDKQE